MTSILSRQLRFCPLGHCAETRLAAREYETLGAYGAKLKLDLLDNPAFPVRGKLILVTATTPTTSGEGKTVVSIGLAQGLEQIGRKAIVTSREPSLGPVFGLKGRSSRRRPVAGGAEPADQSPLPRRFSRHHRRAQPAGGHGRLAPFLWQRAGPRSGADHVAARRWI